jgi:hypothetical protein
LAQEVKNKLQQIGFEIYRFKNFPVPMHKSGAGKDERG